MPSSCLNFIINCENNNLLYLDILAGADIWFDHSVPPLDLDFRLGFYGQLIIYFISTHGFPLTKSINSKRVCIVSNKGTPCSA